MVSRAQGLQILVMFRSLSTFAPSLIAQPITLNAHIRNNDLRHEECKQPGYYYRSQNIREWQQGTDGCGPEEQEKTLLAPRPKSSSGFQRRFWVLQIQGNRQLWERMVYKSS